MKAPSVESPRKTMVDVDVVAPPSWMTPIREYIETGYLPSDPSEATMLKRRASEYTLVEGSSYKIGLYTPLLKNLGDNQATFGCKGVCQKDVESMVFMVDHGSRCIGVSKKVRPIPGTWWCFQHFIYGFTDPSITMVVPVVGVGHPRSISPRTGET